MTRTRCYELLEGPEGLSRLRAEWESLEDAGVEHIFQTWAHVDLWQRTVGTNARAKPLLVVLREDGRAVGIFPGSRIHESGLPLLTWLGSPRALDYGDVIFDADAAETPVAEFVDESLRRLTRAARGTLLFLPNVREDARAFPALSARARVLRTSAAPYVPIHGTWEEYLASRGRDLRHELSRRTRRLEETGACEFALLSPGDPGVAEAVEALTRFQRARFDSPGARTSLSDEHFARFREEQATTDPRSRVARLTLDGEVVAASLHSVYRGRFHCFAPGFDNRFAKYSPGILLRGYVIRSCFENGWDPCDFGWGDEAYKYRWADCAEKLTTFVGTGVTGSLFAAGMGMRRSLVGALGKLRKRQPAG